MSTKKKTTKKIPSKKRKPKLGSGKRFKELSEKLEEKGVTNPNALAAWIGRRKYGNKKFSELAQAGRKRKKGK